MGDMKTPDFDDLLAAFDIPDMVDPKAAIESGHQDNHESQLKHSSTGLGNSEVEAQHSSAVHDVGVSVIVKNIRNMDLYRYAHPFERDARLHSHHSPHSVSRSKELQIGFLAAVPPSDQCTKNGWKLPRNDGLPVATLSTLNQFSPISSAEEFDDDDKIEVDNSMAKRGANLEFKSSVTRAEPNAKCLDNILCNPKVNGSSRHCKTDQNNNNSGSIGCSTLSNRSCTRKPEEESQVTPQQLHCKRATDSPGVVSNNFPDKTKSSAKLSSCIAAIAALTSNNFSTEEFGVTDGLAAQRESTSVTSQCSKAASQSPGVNEVASEQESALEVAKRLLSRQPDSPCSVTSECSSKGSSSSGTETGPVIPKVRIKTIKTSTGQIKRTVTRVPPEFDPNGMQNADICNSVTSSIFSSSTRPSISTTVVATSGGPALEITKQMTIKPVATAFLPVSAVKTAGSQVINLKLANNTTVKATVIPAASVQSASSAILKAANAIQQQTVMVPASSLANAKLMPKAVHLSNLNLLPHTLTCAARDLQQALSSSKQQAKQQLSKKAPRVQVFNSSQSSVVDAFNKILSSINPVPVYVPNLSPPLSASITLPSRGYKCLECGDSFALEKSLTQHYERRSVQIEVTCNHCAKSLVFYNKCSLLSHARSHKDKGVVMQCSHLILKPIPVDQMITTSPPPTPPISNCAPSTSQTQGPTSQATGRALSGGSKVEVISAPCSAPLVAAMPLQDDSSTLSRHSLKCMECNDMFPDDSSLAAHYQHASESSGQKTCNICQMLLPNQCSFLSHQRIHQHKSPYICPECGASCRSVQFQSHVTKNCLHYTRRVGYRCTHCSMILADVATLKSHTQSVHCEVFYKCPICPMAFKSAPGTHSHACTQHPGAKVGEPRLIYKCSMCDTVFSLQSLLLTHFDQHVTYQKVSVFKCPDCSTHYAQKQLMLDHIKAIHGTLKTVEGPPNLGINLPLSTKPTNSNGTNSPCRNGGNSNILDKAERKCPSVPLRKADSNISVEQRNPPGPGYACGDCDTLFNSREAFVAHMRRKHRKILKKYPCQQCDKSFSSAHSLSRHVQLKHKAIRKVHVCPHCPALSQPFTKRVLLDQHIQMMHGIKDQDGRVVSEDNTEELIAKETSNSPKRKSEGLDESACLHDRGSNSQPLKRLKVNVLKVHKCAVCGFTTEDAATFHQHIPQHKSDGSSYQCQQCGLCYTSHPSLARHLFIVHRLREPLGLGRCKGRGKDNDDESQRENQLDVPDENGDGSPNTKCKVCYKVFETEGHLNTHMRTHGMAFIKSKRLSAQEK